MLFIARIETRFDRGAGLDTPEKRRLLDRQAAWNGNCQVTPGCWLSRAMIFIARIETRFDRDAGLDTPEKHRLLDRRAAWKQRVWMAGSQSLESAVRLGHDTPRGQDGQAQAMSDSTRITRKCLVSHLRPELRKAIQDYSPSEALDNLEVETIGCYETTSERKSAGKLLSWLSSQPDTITHVGILLTPERLIWVRWGDRSGTLLTAANLREIRVKVYFSPLAKDTGLEVYGFIGDSKGRVRGYLGMESASIAQQFCDQIRQAIDKVNPPVKRKLPRWLGG